MNMTKPSERLYLSYARISSQGKSLRPSYLIERMEKLFPQIRAQKSVALDPLDQMVGKRDGLTILANELREYAGGRQGIFSEKELCSLYRLYETDEKYGCYAGKLAQSAFERYTHKPLPEQWLKHFTAVCWRTV